MLETIKATKTMPCQETLKQLKELAMPGNTQMIERTRGETRSLKELVLPGDIHSRRRPLAASPSRPIQKQATDLQGGAGVR